MVILQNISETVHDRSYSHIWQENEQIYHSVYRNLINCTANFVWCCANIDWGGYFFTLTILLFLSIFSTTIGILQSQPFWNWAWDRHLNPLSWVVRPLFIPLYAYYAYRRNMIGLFSTLIGIFTSMFWFPIPEYVNPNIVNFLQQEQLYLLTDWTLMKIIWSSLVPVTMIALAKAFWKKSIPMGLLVINVIAFLKITWSVTEDPISGWIVIPFALLGLAITDILVVFVARKKGLQLLPGYFTSDET